MHRPIFELLLLNLALSVMIFASAPVQGSALTAPSQVMRNVQFSNLTAADGLSGETVQAIVQDASGYIWFGTQDGLNRFDGYDIVVYAHDPDDSTTISNNFIWSLYVDREGGLWVTTNAGVNKYDYQLDQFDRNPLQLSREFSDMRVRTIVEDHKGVLWLGTVDEGLVAVEQGRIRRYRHDDGDIDSIPNDNVIALHEDSKRRLWIGTDGGGLARLDRATDTFVNYQFDPENSNSISDNVIRSLYEDRSGNLWIGTAQGGLNLLLDTMGTFRHFSHDSKNPNSLGAGQVPSVYEDDEGTLWVGTESGLSEWRSSTQDFVHYRHDSGNPYSLPGNRVNAIFQDASGVLWLATHGGVSSWNYFSDTFTYYQVDQGYLRNDLVTSLAESRDGALWVGTYGGGLSRLDLSSGRVRHYQSDPTDPDSITDDRVMVVHIDPLDRVWIGTRNGGLNLLKQDGSGFRHFRHDPDDPASISGDAITSLHSDIDGTLWVGVFDGGLNMLQQISDGQFRHFRHDPSDLASLSSDRVLTIHRDLGGSLWVGTEHGGLNKYDSQSGSFQHFPLTESTIDANASAATPWQIVETIDGTFWIATMEHGLIRWDLEQRQAGKPILQRYNQSDGLPSNVYGLVEGSTGDLWLSSNRGLSRFDTRSETVRHFDRHNGLRGSEFTQGAHLRSRSGRLLFGGNKGIVGFFPGELPHNDRPPQLSVAAVSRDKLLARTSSEQDVERVQLGHLDPFIAFDFVALDFVSPDKNQYRYRMAGFEEAWIDADRFRRATYTNLPAGDYRFEVKAANNDGVWNESPVVISVTVIPPPWQRWWAYLGYTLFIFAAIGWYLRAQANKQRQAVELQMQLEQEVAERTAELAARNVELQAVNEKLAEASVTDSLTGLRNRRFVDQFITTEISMVERRLNEQVVSGESAEQRDSSKLLFFMMIDLDGFKLINDTYGHHAGDDVLVEVKEALLECCRRSDVIVRWGGDEFMIIGHASSFAGVKILAERIREGIAERRYDVGGGNVGRLSASIGISPFPFAVSDTKLIGWELVAGIADQAAYLAKQNGRNAWVSIRGSDRMGDGDVARAAQGVAPLVEEGLLVVDSSFGPHLDLYGGSGMQAAAGGR